MRFRFPRSATATAIAGTVVFGLGACGDPAGRNLTPDPDTDAATSLAAPTQVAFDTSWEVPAYTPSQSAVALFGEDGAREGAEVAIQHIVDVSLNEDLSAAETTDAATKKQALSYAKQMTTDAAKDYRTIVEGYFGKGSKAQEDNQSSMFSFATISTLDPENQPVEGPIFSEQEIKTIGVEADSIGRLIVTVKVAGKLRGVFDDENQIATFKRDQSFWMERTPNDGWKFDGWSGDLRIDTPKTE